MVIIKIYKIISIISIALLVVVSIAFVVFYIAAEKDLAVIIRKMDAQMTEFITEFDGTNLGDSQACEATLMHISDALYPEIESQVEFIQEFLFQDFTDEINEQLELLRKESKDAGFAFSFAALNGCRGSNWFKLEEDKLKQSLLKMKDNINKLQELCGQEC